MDRRAVIMTVGLGVLTFAAGCQRAFTREHYDMVQVGADREEVQHLLGRPTSDLEDQWFYDDLDRHYSAVIHFDERGRVRAKEWMDARTGRWEGRSPHAGEPPQGEVREHHKRTTVIDED